MQKRKTGATFPNALLFSVFLFSGIDSVSGGSLHVQQAGRPIPKIWNVPADYPTIAAAVQKAENGDQIILAPGIYKENTIDLHKAITISSKWKLDKRQEHIDKTVIDAEGKTLFNINVDGTEISGLSLINGDHTLENKASVRIIHNHFINNLDAISMEGGSGGYIANNLIENDRDDGIDMDIGDDARPNIGTDIVVTGNTIVNSHDDGIEIRLFKRPNQNIRYDIGNNRIIGSKNAGIQLISYDVPTGKIFNIHHNTFQYCKTALGCMSGGRTMENLEGTDKMDETVYFYNNSIAYNQMAATGGNHIVAINNVLYKNTLGGFKHFGAESVLVNNLFYDNNGADLTDINSHVAMIHAQVSLGADPGLNELEALMGKNSQPAPKAGYSSAGNDMVVTEAEFTVNGKQSGEPGNGSAPFWKQVGGLAEATLSTPNALSSTVKLPKPGIYEFLFSSSLQSSGSDKLTVRYISKAKKQEYLFRDTKENTFQAGGFQYAYGTFREEQPNNSLARGAVLMEKGAALEYSLGITQSRDYFLWIKAKTSSKSAMMDFTYDHKTQGLIEVSNRSGYSWYKLDSTIQADAGQWSLILHALSGNIQVKDILFTPDATFNPAK
ncbi:right-handed parallel beta-helix repeat-containing protein [Pedobacter sp. AW31-3R]|uniref:right-handed parallel beta-helix repeat-containing protein n=1 Tax=Pedobacter sp. AW31-3R TaxID=3445781 RepID=UPI003F9F05C2